MSAQAFTFADTITILIAEDSPTQAEHLKYLLERHHYRVIVAENGRKAVSLLMESAPALVITDIVMPEMNGYDLCKWIKSEEETHDIPVILLTSLVNSEDVLEGLACGADNFITKPYNEEYLLLSIERILASKRLRKSERVRIGMEITLGGKKRFITADQQQMLSLLISTYEAAVLRNTELSQTQDELRSLNEHLEDLVHERTAALSAEIAERRRAEEREKHVNIMLRAIRNVNQLITQEKDRDTLIRKICAVMTQKGFRSAFIVLVDDKWMFLTMAESGLTRNSPNLTEAMKRGEWPNWAQTAFAQTGIVAMSDTDDPCMVCQPMEGPDDHNTLAIRLECDGMIYGVMMACLPAEMAADEDERDLFREIAGDVAFGLHALRQDEARRKTEAAIIKLNNELEERIENRTAELQVANRELEAFSYSVSHDLQAPLRAIDGYITILREDYESCLDEEGKRICSSVNNSARNMGKLIDDLLSFSRISRTEMQPASIDTDALVRAAFLELTTPEARQSIDFQVGRLPRIHGDPVLIRQVWMNLIGNAVKFSAKKERPVIRVSAEQRDDGTLIYSIRDNGAGFDMAYADKLFSVFHRLHNARDFEGTGVGLAIVQRIIQRHGGKIWAEAKPDEGAIFSFFLPG